MKMHNNLSRAARTSRRHALLVLGGVAVLLATSAQAAGWMDISGALLERLTNSGAKPAWPGGCSGVVANRETGAIIIKVVGCGLWRSSDQGVTWERIDEDHVSGRDETGWATSADQNTPTRMASFSLDGLAGWTTDGRHWKSFTSLGRNWDFGSVDWSAEVPKTIIAAKHETNPPGEVYATTDGGVTWKKLAMLVIGNDGVFTTQNAGQTWIRAAGLKPKEGDYVFSPNWFGCYAWDPIHRILYASAMGNPVYKLRL